jgi:zinc metalloprotease ZmpA
VHYGSAKTWDYYKTVHGRNGIAGDGKGALSRVHYGKRYNNAFWQDSCFCMSYGDGDGSQFNPLVGVDVTGHEMSHGVTSHTANLTYSGESGGLNEATSDIFGTMVEFYANNADDPPDFKIGEEITPSGTPLRDMAQPSRDGASQDCYSATTGTADVHYSSGVANHFFYLLSQGSGTGPYDSSTTCAGAPGVTGIGNGAAEKIWYRALTVYMTSSTNYAGARTATLNAARDLYGAGSAQYSAVAAAWTAVNV